MMQQRVTKCCLCSLLTHWCRTILDLHILTVHNDNPNTWNLSGRILITSHYLGTFCFLHFRSKMGKAILSQPACVSKLLSLLLDQRWVVDQLVAIVSFHWTHTRCFNNDICVLQLSNVSYWTLTNIEIALEKSQISGLICDLSISQSTHFLHCPH